MKGRIWGKKKRWIKIFFNNGLLGLITVPPHPTVENITLLLNPEKLNKIAFSPWRLQNNMVPTPEEYGCTLDEYGSIYSPKNYGSTSEEFHEN